MDQNVYLRLVYLRSRLLSALSGSGARDHAREEYRRFRRAAARHGFAGDIAAVDSLTVRELLMEVPYAV